MIFTLPCQNGPWIAYIRTHYFIILYHNIDQRRPAAWSIYIRVSYALLNSIVYFRNAIRHTSKVQFILISFRYVFNDVLRNQMPKSSMSVSDSVQIDSFICQVSFYYNTVLINFVRVSYLYSLFGPVWIALSDALLFLIHNCGFLAPVAIHWCTTVVSILAPHRFIVISLLVWAMTTP